MIRISWFCPASLISLAMQLRCCVFSSLDFCPVHRYTNPKSVGTPPMLPFSQRCSLQSSLILCQSSPLTNAPIPPPFRSFPFLLHPTHVYSGIKGGSSISLRCVSATPYTVNFSSWSCSSISSHFTLFLPPCIFIKPTFWCVFLFPLRLLVLPLLVSSTTVPAGLSSGSRPPLKKPPLYAPFCSPPATPWVRCNGCHPRRMGGVLQPHKSPG